MDNALKDKTVPSLTYVKNVEVTTAEDSAQSPSPLIAPVTTNQQIQTLHDLAHQHQHQKHKQEIVTPKKAVQLDNMLHSYDSAIRKFLVDGFTFGLKIPYFGLRNHRISCYPKSLIGNVPILKQKIQKEIDAGRVAGPFNNLPFPNLEISPLGLVPKKVSGEFRFIHNLSYPEGHSINDGIPREFCTVQYQNIDNAVALIKQFGKGCLLSKTNLENAYRIIPLSPVDYELMGFLIDKQYYYDKTLPQGLSHSCFLFEVFSTALHWIAENQLGISGCAHILDDFLLWAHQITITV